MATSFLFNDKNVILPGVYTQTKAAVDTPPLALPYGNIAVIDTGSAAGWGSAGSRGQMLQGKDSVYEFDNLIDFREFIRGGEWYLGGQSLFQPNGSGTNGISKLFWISAKESTNAIIDLNFTAGGNGGSIELFTLEGVGANGNVVDELLEKGFGVKMRKGVSNQAAFILDFYMSGYQGMYNDLPVNGQTLQESDAILIAQSEEFETMAELLLWMSEDVNFNRFFTINNQSINGTGVIVAADLTANTDWILAVGGTENYTQQAFDDALAAIADLDVSFILSDKHGADAQHADNVKILDHINNNAVYDEFLMIGGATKAINFQNQSIETAKFFDSEKVMVVHGGVRLNAIFAPLGYREMSALHKACLTLGRIAGLQPQTPLAFKLIKIQGEVHNLTAAEQKLCLKHGVLATVNRTSTLGGFAILQGINTLQKNNRLVNQDGKSHDIAVMRIAAQLNKELSVNAFIDLLGNQSSGPNRNTLSAADFKSYIQGFLEKRSASPGQDNLIISYRDIIVKTNQDSHHATYKFEPNYPIHKLFVTSFIVDSNATA